MLLNEDIPPEGIAKRVAEREQPSTPVQVVHIAPGRRGLAAQLAEIWQYRDLLYFLVWRDVKVRYKQTLLGAAWAILQPLMAMVMLSVFFGKLARMPSNGIPYPLFAFSALIPWQLFAHGLSQSANSLVANQGLIKKVYFPRIIAPLASILEGLVDFAIAFSVLLVMMLAYGYGFSLRMLLLPLLILLAVGVSLSLGLWLSALNARYRDIRYTLTFLTQIWMFATPIAYPTSLVPEQWRLLYSLNPMVGVVDGFRWALLGSGAPPDASLLVCVVEVVVAMAFGAAYFRRVESSIADLL